MTGSPNDAETPDPLSDYEPAKYTDPMQRVLAEETVEAIESRPFVTVEASTPVRQAIELLHQSGVSSLMVLKDDRLVGIFTERDVLEKVVESYERVATQAVESFMTAEPTIVYQSDPAAAALAAISVAGHRHVPVLDLDENVQGILSPRRVFQFVDQRL
jgi:CBS domain-containing protein